MKTIGIIAAMESEIAQIKAKMDTVVSKRAVCSEFYIGSLAGKSIVAVKCGVGKVNAAVVTQALIDLFAVDYIINTGVAGGIYRDITIGGVVIATEAVYHDFDCTALGFEHGIIPWAAENVFTADETLVAIAKRAASELELKNKVYSARIASGDIFVADTEKKKEIWEKTQAYCVEMEGAAIAHACTLNKIPFAIIRSVSDNSDSDGHDDFSEFLEIAAKISSNLTEKMVEYI